MSIKIDIVSNLYAMYIYILNKNTPAMHIFEYSILPPGFFGGFFFFFEKRVMGRTGCP